MSDVDRCTVSRCRNASDIFYYGIPLCDEHWTEFSELPVKELKSLLGILDNQENKNDN